MKENEPEKTGLSAGVKSMLIILAIMLSIIIFLIWSAILREAGNVAAGSIDSVRSDDEEAEPTDDEDSSTDPVALAREPIIAMVDAPACENAENDAALLSEFVAASPGGLSEDDRQLVIDTLGRIDSTCPKDFTLELSARLSGPEAALELAQISADADWVSRARPAPEDAATIAHFSTDNRNIHCTLENTRVACSIYSYSFPSEPAACETYTQTFVVQESTDASGLCSWRVQSENQVGPGTYASENFACQVKDNSSVECWSQLSGKGFEVNRTGSRTF
ncbi:hypothetical protein [Flaviflexus huanghaiensis]|uniref:hypothetical protein n=1 Tax=Flaviflexus huanghaiensis TaxID=1111473 RepID=UPI0015FDD0CF|nr:hypothetical protein [Flaviflexus huanghaiensis]